jgi:deoxyribodipyrimidine photo-lyase
MAVAPDRIRILNAAPPRPERAYVLHWMEANRRVRHNPALGRAAELSRALARPLLVLESLRVDEPHASDRLHTFAMQGMAENGRRLAGRALHHAFVERRAGETRALVAALASRACAVVVDDYPASDVPRVTAEAARDADVRFEAVDASCVVPFRLAGKDYPTAYAYRRFLHGALPAWLERLPPEDALRGAALRAPPSLPAAIARAWPAADPADLDAPGRLVASLPIDHGVPPAPLQGGSAAAEARLAAWLRDGLPRYADERNAPDAEGVTSGLSPWLRAGQLSSFEVVRAVLRREGWTPALLSPAANGARQGFWGASPPAEAFLDQIVTWRELGFVTCAHVPGHRTWASLPSWARATLEAHASDPRPRRYGRDALEQARTSDALWNAAQRQLLREGTIHGYVRMLWGKRVLAWTRSPRGALDLLLELNDRWALDGRDPNSVSGIFWCLGRYDRPWPERAVYGTVRTMTSESTARKVSLRRWLARFGAPG